MNLPIGLTLSRIVLVPLLIVFLISSYRVNVLIAAAIFLLAAVTDWLDGLIARRRNQVTTLGALLDPVADKLLVAAALVSLLQIEKVAAWMVVVIVGRELAVTGLRAVAATVGVIVPASQLAKWKTVGQYIAITMLGFPLSHPRPVAPACGTAVRSHRWLRRRASRQRLRDQTAAAQPRLRRVPVVAHARW